MDQGGHTMNDVSTQLDALAAQVARGDLGTADDWGGADVVITATPKPDGPEPSFYPDPRFVVTEFAPQLSWLFLQLRDAFAPRLDAHNKYEFYGRLADAATSHLADNPDAATAQTLCTAVLHEASVIS
jgi:hypothetical protein